MKNQKFLFYVCIEAYSMKQPAKISVFFPNTNANFEIEDICTKKFAKASNFKTTTITSDTKFELSRKNNTTHMHILIELRMLNS